MAPKYPCVSITISLLLAFLFFASVLPDVTWVSLTSSLMELGRGGAKVSHDVGDSVDVCFSRVWPLNNPNETYDFFGKVGICKMDKVEPAHMSLGQILRGARLTKTKYDITFATDSKKKTLCSMQVPQDQLEEWRDMIDASYLMEVYVDDLPVHAHLGKRGYELVQKKPYSIKAMARAAVDKIKQSSDMGGSVASALNGLLEQGDAEGSWLSMVEDEDEDDGEQYRNSYHLATHLEFVIGQNEGKVVHAEINPTKASDGTPAYTDITEREGDPPLRDISFTYSVRWEDRPDIPVHLRLYTQLRSAFSTQPAKVGGKDSMDIHWLALTNSFVLVVLVLILLGLVLMRVLKADMAGAFLLGDEELAVASVEEESGWKLLHADVFRPPVHRMALSAMLGCGLHLLLVAIAMITVGTISPYLPWGTVLAFGFMGYLLTTFIAGFVSTSVYTKMGGVRWTWNTIVACCIFLLPAFVVWSMLNIVAAINGSTAALPFTTAFGVLLCLLFVTVPMTILGGIMGRRRVLHQMEGGQAYPCKTNKLAREIPRVRWYHSPWLHMLLAGFLPFSGIYIELHYVFLSVWSNSKMYTYSFLLLAVFLLLTSSVAVSMLMTYLHLNGEDHRWPWRAFLSGGSVAIYFLLHCIYYFFSSTEMTGAVQVSHFFGYSILFAWMMCLMVGCTTYFSTAAFIRYIYSRIKCD